LTQYIGQSTPGLRGPPPQVLQPPVGMAVGVGSGSTVGVGVVTGGVGGIGVTVVTGERVGTGVGTNVLGGTGSGVGVGVGVTLATMSDRGTSKPDLPGQCVASATPPASNKNPSKTTILCMSCKPLSYGQHIPAKTKRKQKDLSDYPAQDRTHQHHAHQVVTLVDGKQFLGSPLERVIN
jgi:hypothetical protein